MRRNTPSARDLDTEVFAENDSRSRTNLLRLAISLFIPGFILSLGLSSIVPIVPVFAKSFGVSFGLASLVVTATAVGKAVANIPSGFLVDKIGRRTPVLASPLIVAVASALAGLSTTYPALVLWRFVEGVGLSVWEVSRNTIIIDEVPKEMRGRIVSFYYAFYAFGAAIGPVIGGFVATDFGIRATFFSYSFAAILCFLGLLVSIRETKPKARAGPLNIRRSFRFFASLGPLKMTFVIACFGLITNAVRNASNQALFPLFGSFELNLSEISVGIALGLWGVTQTIVQLPAGFITDKLGRKKAIVPSQLIGGLAFAAMAFANDYNTVLLLMMISGAGAGLTGGSLRAIGGDLSPEESRGTFMGIWVTVSDIGSAIGPLVLGFLADYAGLRVPYLASGAVLLLSGFLIQFFSVETLTFERNTQVNTK